MQSKPAIVFLNEPDNSETNWDLKVRESLSGNYDVMIASSLNELKVHHQERKALAILVSILPPHGKGYEWIEALREDKSWDDLPILAVVSSPSSATRCVLYRYGADAIIGRDEDLEILCQMTSKLIRDSRFVTQLKETLEKRSCDIYVESTEIMV